MLSRIIRTAVLGVAMTIAGCSSGNSLDSWNQYGKCDLTRADRIVVLDALNPATVGPVTVEGIVAGSGGEREGWMNIVSGSRTARVTFKDSTIRVPREASGHRVVVVGFGQPVLVDVAYARLLAEQAGQTREEIAAISGPVQVYEIEATGVYLEWPHSAWPSDVR